jgi:hypothetical protein
MSRKLGWGVLGALLFSVYTIGAADAMERDFAIVADQSNIAISGTVTNTTFGTALIQAQGPGGLTTSYSGTINTDRIGNAISFLAGSAINAATGGPWQPLIDGNSGSSPANYGAKVVYLGGFVTINFAGRNLVAGLIGPATTLDSSGNFDLAATSVAFASGDLAYRGPAGNPVGTNSLANKSALLSGTGSLSSLTQSGQTTETLTFPVNATFNFAADTTTSISLTLTGQLLAKSTFSAGIPGDYNQNGVVDEADYVLWRNQLGSGTSLPNDDTAGVGNDDYSRWRAHFGQSSATGTSQPAQSALVPEPKISSLFALLITIGSLGRLWTRP